LTAHIAELQIERFRGIKEMKICDLGDVNVFVGDNNAGKTSILEAIQIMSYPSEYNFVRVAQRRDEYRDSSSGLGRLGIIDSFMYLFHGYSGVPEPKRYSIELGGRILNQEGSVKITGSLATRYIDLNLNENKMTSMHLMKSGAERGLLENPIEALTFVGDLYFTFTEPRQISSQGNAQEPEKIEINDYIHHFIVREPSFRRLFEVQNLSPIDHIIGNAFSSISENREAREQAVTLLKKFDENIIDLRYINKDKRFIPVVETARSGNIPLSMYGDGMKKALTMLNAIIPAKSGVVLIDEFETAIHTSAMKTVFSFILESAKKMDVQLFLTTHSIEALDKLIESAEGQLDRLRVIRLKKKNEKTYAKAMTGSEAKENRERFDMELRI
jgi:predicted ATPase